MCYIGEAMVSVLFREAMVSVLFMGSSGECVI